VLECAVFVVRRGRAAATAAPGVGDDDDDTQLLAREIVRVWVALGGVSPASTETETEQGKTEGEKSGTAKEKEKGKKLHVDARRAAQLIRGALSAAGSVGGGECFLRFFAFILKTDNAAFCVL
jgi:hypothetical protein